MFGTVELDALIGARVSLRQRVGGPGGRPRYRDAVGVLTESDGKLAVRTRRGPVAVDRAAVVAVREVPPAPPQRAGLGAVVALEAVCADAWPAAVDEPLGEWRLRAAGGWTGRANSALAIGDPGLPIPGALAAVRDFAARHDIPARVQVPVGSPWDRAVERAGWRLDTGHEAGAEVSVLVTDLAEVAALPVPAAVDIAETPAADWFPPELRSGTPPAAARVIDPGGRPRTAFALVRYADGAVLGRVRTALVGAHLHVSMLAVTPQARGRGLATGLLAATAAWGREHGARWGVLQVALHNTGARSLYTRIGAAEHHRYRYLVP